MLTPTDIQYLERAISLARNGALSCAPNPMVGAVVVGPDGRILGEGYHIRTGEGHAEVNALNSVCREDQPLLAESTIYVSLEPCAHYGKTPPCAELIIRRGLKRCVIGCQDPFGKVNGKGIQMLREAGVEVELAPEDIRRECLLLNKKFVCQHRLGRPFITLKWAQVQDPLRHYGAPPPLKGRNTQVGSLMENNGRAKVSLPLRGGGGSLDEGEADGGGRKSYNNIIGVRGERLLISTPQSVMWGHKLRAEHQAILVGHGTLTADAPSLNVRHWAESRPTHQRNPSTFVLGRCSEEELPRGWQAFATIDDLLEHLQRQGTQSLLVEGGAQVLQSFVERDLWDEVWVEQGKLSADVAERIADADCVEAPHMPPVFPHTKEEHFGSTFMHWKSPLLQNLYGL